MAKAVDVPIKEKKLVAYRYEAINVQGKTIKGTIKASGEIEAERLLIEQGYRPVSVEVVPSMFALEEALPSLFQIKPRDVIVFSRQTATLLKSGVSLLPAMEILQEQVSSGRTFRKTLGTIVNDLRSGGSFVQALAKHPKAFNEIYCRTIAVGERTGNLEMVLNRMADYLEKQGTLAKKLKGALTYPIMVLGVGLVVCVVLMVAVMPKLTTMFASMNLELPLPTKILIGASNLFITYPIHMIIGAAVILAAALWMIKQPSGRRLLDRLRLKAPLIGIPTLMGELARFSRTTSVLISAGLSLQEIMEIAPQCTSNKAIQDALREVYEKLLLGEGLSEPMSRIDLFPPLLVQMVAVGEESNTLDFTLGVVADFYEVTAEDRMSAMVGMMGPLSTLGIALFVGLIAMAVLGPMYSILGGI